MHSQTTPSYAPPGPRESLASIVRILALQALVGSFAAVIALLAAGPLAGLSALIGVALCLVPGVFFVVRILPGFAPGADAPRIMRGFYRAEALKLGLTALLFIGVFSYVDNLRPEMLFIGFLVTHFSVIFAAWVGE